jgi:hypothetical protein
MTDEDWLFRTSAHMTMASSITKAESYAKWVSLGCPSYGDDLKLSDEIHVFGCVAGVKWKPFDEDLCQHVWDNHRDKLSAFATGHRSGVVFLRHEDGPIRRTVEEYLERCKHD